MINKSKTLYLNLFLFWPAEKKCDKSGLLVDIYEVKGDIVTGMCKWKHQNKELWTISVGFCDNLFEISTKCGCQSCFFIPHKVVCFVDCLYST